jgi:hypothetical protein
VLLKKAKIPPEVHSILLTSFAPFIVLYGRFSSVHLSIFTSKSNPLVSIEGFLQ